MKEEQISNNTKTLKLDIFGIVLRFLCDFKKKNKYILCYSLYYLYKCCNII